MNSLDIKKAEISIKQYLNSLDFPMEVKRLIVKEIYDEVNSGASMEVNQLLSKEECKEGEVKNE